MKAIWRIVLGLSLMSASCAWAIDIQGAHSGSWYNEDQSGHGFSIQVLNEETLVAYWFVFNPTGEPIFLLAVADIDGNSASGPVYQYSGMRFGEFDPETVNEEAWGYLTINFWDCESATAVYQSTAAHHDVPYGSGTFALTRLTGIRDQGCSEPEPLSKYGNYVADVKQGGVNSGTARLMILRNGVMAYFARITDALWWFGVGQVTMTGDNSFDYVMVVDKPLKEVFEGSGSFSGDGVSLEMPGGYSLDGVIDPAVLEGISMDQIAGTHEEIIPLDPLYAITLHIAEDGSVSGNWTPTCEIFGKVTIPDPGFNQFLLEAEWCQPGPDIPNQSISGVGTIRDGGIVMITEWRIGGAHFATFEWEFGWQDF